MSSSPSSSLQSLLTQLEPLHQHHAAAAAATTSAATTANKDTAAVTRLSLQQLVPVHAAWLRQQQPQRDSAGSTLSSSSKVDQARVQRDAVAVEVAPRTWAAWLALDPLMGWTDEDRQACQQLLLEESSPSVEQPDALALRQCRILLTIQFVLHRLALRNNNSSSETTSTTSPVAPTDASSTSPSSDPLMGLCLIVWPLVHHHHQQWPKSATSHRDTWSSPELWGALLQALFHPTATTTNSTDAIATEESPWLGTALSWMLQDVSSSTRPSDSAIPTPLPPSPLVWHVGCQILGRLRAVSSAAPSTITTTSRRRRVEQCLLTWVQEGLRWAVTLHQSTEQERNDSALVPTTDDVDPSPVSQTTRSSSVAVSDLLGPILQHFLPWLLSSDTTTVPNEGDDGEDATSTLWLFVWEEFLLPPSGAASSWLVGTAVLSVLVAQAPGLRLPAPPSWSSSSKNSSQEDGNNNRPPPQAPQDRKRPLYHPCLWHMVETCLQSGVGLRKRHGSWLLNTFAPPPPDTTTVSPLEQPFQSTDPGASELLRRRGVHLLRILLEHEQQTLVDGDNNNKSDESVGRYKGFIRHWNRYVACLETAEMETESHLIEQIWETVQSLAVAVASDTSTTGTECPPPLNWFWLEKLWVRLLLSNESPVLRKACLAKFCQGKAGVLLQSRSELNQKDQTTAQPQAATQKKKKKKSKAKMSSVDTGMPLDFVTAQFVVHVLFPCYDSLEQAVGTHLHVEEHGKVVKYNVADDLTTFLHSYLCLSLSSDAPGSNSFSDFLSVFLETRALLQLRKKTVVFLLESVADLLDQQAAATNHSLGLFSLDDQKLNLVAHSMCNLCQHSFMIPVYRELARTAMARILSHSSPASSVASALPILQLYELPEPIFDESQQWIDSRAYYRPLQRWLQRMQDSDEPGLKRTRLAATVAAAYVDGYLYPTDGSKTSTKPSLSFASDSDMATGRATILLCGLLDCAASEVLWPAIHKGVSLANASLIGKSWYGWEKVSRGVTLMRDGCQLQLISGSGNGDLVVDRTSQQMMPPPPSIEQMVSLAASFVLERIRFVIGQTRTEKVTTSSRSSDAKRITAAFVDLIAILDSLNIGYPSSLALPQVMGEQMNKVQSEMEGASTLTVDQAATIYACLTAGVRPSDTLKLGTSFLQYQYNPIVDNKSDSQPLRSIYQCSRWGVLALLTTDLVAKGDSRSSKYLDNLFQLARDNVEACPSEGLLYLFRCVRMSIYEGIVGQNEIGPRNLNASIAVLFDILNNSDNNIETVHILDEVCSLLFQPKLLLKEHEELMQDTSGPSPIRDAFRRILKEAGTMRPHMIQVAVARICAGWLGSDGSSGLSAVPYREDILQLVSFKEATIDLSSTSKTKVSDLLQSELPKGTHGQSIVRSFFLCFFERLPDPKNLSEKVSKDLLETLILRLAGDTRVKDQALMMLGSPEYCRKIRVWQTLCVLSRFVTDDIVNQVCDEVFLTLEEPLHGQIRYFVEVFCIQCARRFPAVFGSKLAAQISRCDLNLQLIASLMVIAGNLIVGKYKDDFLQATTAKSSQGVDLHKIVAGTIPWLSSTQGFSRAIAQLLVHKLIPLVVDVNTEETGGGGTNWYLMSLYRFLDENSEMKRLRIKQSKFFEKYDADKACTPEHILSIPVDEGGDANPEHMVDIIKECLVEVYDEAHGDGAPTWKRVKELMEQSMEEPQSPNGGEWGDVNFQRKIIPLDLLNFALEDAREKKQRNIAGRRKQPLIVCASLIDKVPNLGGLARTAEIFAASRLVIPDMRFTKMDNFKSLSVGAGEWIEVEECTEENLLPWLQRRKEEGFFIVGVEQTSSSVSLMEFFFPDAPIVLLLGKEKEGIPVQFLQAVDQCVEIPQLGIIRSLNVHVSGAISIWEYTRQQLLKQQAKSASN